MEHIKFRKILMVGIDESKLDTPCWQRLRQLCEKIVLLPKGSPDIKKQLADTDCLLVNFGIQVGKAEIESAPSLRYIGVLATAYGKIDTGCAKGKNITVSNIPGYSTEAVAEFVFAAILENIRELEKGKNQARKGNYSEAGFSASEIKGKVFGILGAGRIGSRVAEIALGFGADVRYWSRNRKSGLEAKGTRYEDADRLIPKCDFLSIHFAQTAETEGFLDRKRIQSIKKGAVVVNTAPMELVDMSSLAERLGRQDMVFILDHSDEMNNKDLKRLSGFDNCIIYPPIAYVTKEAKLAKQEIFLGNIENFLAGRPSNTI